MIISTSTGNDIVIEKTGSDALDRHLEIFFDTPFRYFELDMFSAAPSRDSVWMREGDDWKRTVERVRKISEDRGYHFISAHSMSCDAYADRETVRLVQRAVERTFEACHMLEIPATVLHGLMFWKERGEQGIEEKTLRRNLDFYLSLADSSEKYGVDILAENYARDCAPVYPFTEGAAMYDFVKRSGIPRLHICWDTGHANICAERSQYEDILALKDELRSLHIHDNWGDVDAHSIPFSGTVNFDEILRALKEIGYRGTFNLEAGDMFIISSEEGRGRKRWNCSFGDKLADPPDSVMSEYYRLLYCLSDWMLSEYGLNER